MHSFLLCVQQQDLGGAKTNEYRNDKTLDKMMTIRQQHSTGAMERNDDEATFSSKSTLLTPPTTQIGVSLRTAEWTTNKLRFENLGLYGRKEEILEIERAISCMVQEDEGTTTVQHIRKNEETNPAMDAAKNSTIDESKIVDRIQPQKEQKEFLLVSGYSGTGKTALVSSAIGNISKQRIGGTIAWGKFDQSLGGDGTQQQQQQQQPPRQSQPFAAFGMICQALAEEIYNLKTSKNRKSQLVFENLKDAIMMELGTELIDLIQIFPSLDVIISFASNKFTINDSQRSDIENHHMERQETSPSYSVNITSESRHRFIYGFRMLVRIISTFLSPLVFVLDDLQWADVPSLELLEGLVLDQAKRQMLIIGIYRSNEVDETHVLSKTLQVIRSNAAEIELRITEMKVENLHINAVQEMLHDLLSMKEDYQQEKILKLAEICHKKTGGNAFYIVHFLSMLYDEHLLTYDDRSFEWEWDVQGIGQVTKATDNVVDILKQAMYTLSLDDQQILQFGAYLGSVFDETSIYFLWKDFERQGQRRETDRSKAPTDNADANEKTRTSLKEGIRSCVKAGYFEHLKQQKLYRWAHDKLQEAAMDLVAAKDHRSFSKKVAEALYSNLNDSELEAAIFVVTNRFNEGTVPQDPLKRLQLAKLNLRAANKATAYSAFESVSIYCEYATNLLPPDCWEKYYRLSLELYSLGAEAEGFLGNIQQMEKYYNEVLRQNEVTESWSSFNSSVPTSTGGIRDKLRVYNAMMVSFQNRNMSHQASDMCLDVLRQFGISFPRNKAGVLARVAYNIGKIKATIKSRTAQEAQALPRMEDPILIEQMTLLGNLASFLFYVDKTLFLLPMFKAFDLTLKHGLCKYAPTVFASVSLLVTVSLGDFHSAAVYARYALILLDKLDPSQAKQVKSKTLLLAHSFTLHWTQPLERMLKPMFQGYEAGMHSGDIENAVHCIYCHTWFSLISGKTLRMIERDCRAHIVQMNQHKHSLTMNRFRAMRQFVLNLMGRSEFTTKLTGEALNEDACRKEGDEDTHTIHIVDLHRIMLLSIFGDYEEGAKLSFEVGESVQKISPALLYVPIDLFHRSMCFVGLARQLKHEGLNGGSSRRLGRGIESKCFKSAKQGLGKIKKWIEKGNPNVRHYEFMLEAELSAYQGQWFLARKHYETAITIATQAGFLHDCALANERYGEFLLHIEASGLTRQSSENLQEATFRIQESIDLYREWGAEAKAESVESTHSFILGSGLPSHVVVP